MKEHGGARKKLVGTRELANLSNEKLIELINTMSSEQIAIDFKINPSTVSLEITNRKLFVPNKSEKEKNYKAMADRNSLEPNEPYNLNEDRYGYFGAWKELKETQLYKTILGSGDFAN